jgi:hypothetical protein
MIISKISGGLGNQMFQYAIGQSVATKYKKPFNLDLSDIPPNSPFKYRLDMFNIKAETASANDINKMKGKSDFSGKILRKFLGSALYPFYHKESERTIFDSSVFSNSDIYLDGYWQNEEYFLDIRSVLLDDFSLKSEVSNNAKKYLEPIMLNNSVSLHVRRGDYSKHPEIGIMDIEYYKKAVEYICKKIDKPVFYIFSNDIKWCESNFTFIENKVFINDTESEIDDLFLMKSCSHNIIANSSFSWWAAWLNTNKQKIIISPLKWMAVNPKGHKWVPDSWLQF